MSGFSKITLRVVALAATTILVDTDHKLFTHAANDVSIALSKFPAAPPPRTRRLNADVKPLDQRTRRLNLPADFKPLDSVVSSGHAAKGEGRDVSRIWMHPGSAQRIQSLLNLAAVEPPNSFLSDTNFIPKSIHIRKKEKDSRQLIN